MPIWKCCSLIYSFKLCICQDPRIARAYTAQNIFFSHLPLVSLSPHPRSRRGAERIRQGEGRWSRPPKTALERSNLTVKFQFRESHTEAETKKTPDQIPVPLKKKNHYICMYAKYDVRFFLARCSPAAECFFSHFRPRGKLACHGYMMKHFWISAELRGGARRSKHRSAGSIWQGIAFLLPETSRSLGTPEVFFQILIF